MRTLALVAALASLFTLGGCARSHHVISTPGSCVQGSATYYSDALAGHRTANGEPYDPHAHTAAVRDFPLGSSVRVSWGQRSVTVRVNDRGPFGRDGVVDLSRAAAEELGMVRAGRVPVRVCLVAAAG